MHFDLNIFKRFNKNKENPENEVFVYIAGQSSKTQIFITIALLGVLGFIFLATFAPFRNGLFSLLFPKSASHAAAFSPEDWPQLQHDQTHSGIGPQSIVGPYSKKWEFDAAISSRVQPVVVAGSLYIGSNDSNMYALDALSGATLWKYKTGGKIVDTAGYSYTTNYLYFGSTDQNVYALDTTKNGSLAWKKNVGGMVRAAVLIANNMVYVGSDDGVMHAIDQTSGNELWSFTTDRNVPIISAAVYDSSTNTIFFGAEDAKAYALDANTGALKWKTQLSGQGFQNRWPVVINSSAGTKVVFSTMPALNFHTPLAYACSVQTPVMGSPWATQKAAYVTHLQSNPDYRSIHVLDAATGSEDLNTPILFGVAGSQNGQDPPVGTNDTDTKVLYRFSENYSSNTCYITNNYTWLYAGAWNLSTQDITNLDTIGANPASIDFTRKAALISDEVTVLSQGGNNLYFTTWRGLYTEDLTTKLFSGILQSNNDSLTYLPYSSPIILHSSGSIYPPKAEDEFENLSPVVISDGLIYYQILGTLVAIQGTVQ